MTLSQHDHMSYDYIVVGAGSAGWNHDYEKYSVYCWPHLKARRTNVQEPYVYMRGREVGGSSAINSLAAIRGIPEDFDLWEQRGCTGWSFAQVLPTLRRLENDLDYGDHLYHGRRGPFPSIDRPSRRGSPSMAPSGTRHSISGTAGSTIIMPQRAPARERPNLTIMGEALVDRVEFLGSRVTGVRVRTAGSR